MDSKKFRAFQNVVNLVEYERDPTAQTAVLDPDADIEQETCQREEDPFAFFRGVKHAIWGALLCWGLMLLGFAVLVSA